MKKRNFLKKAANSFAGRLLRRLCGEENGAVMMEYIVVGLLIAAAAVVAISAFGQTITQMFASLGASVTGDHAAATDLQDTAQATMAAGVKDSDEYVSTARSKKSGITATKWGGAGK